MAEPNETMVAELKRLEDRRGRLTAPAVLEEAADPSSPLHLWFDWDDTMAAAKWRLEQARELIRSVKMLIVVEEREIPAVVYLRDPAAKGNASGYVALRKVRQTDIGDMLTAELRQIEGLLDRLCGIVNATPHAVPAQVQSFVASAQRSLGLAMGSIGGNR